MAAAVSPFDPISAFLNLRETLQRPLTAIPDFRVTPTAPVAPVVPTGQGAGSLTNLVNLVPKVPAKSFAPTPTSTSAGGLTVGQATGLTPAEAWIITRESGGRTTAKNPSSGAYGFGQLNPSSGTLQSISKQLGFDPYTNDPAQQLAMFRHYVQQRYGTAEKAQQFWQTHNWY